MSAALDDIAWLLSSIDDDDILPRQCSFCGAQTRTVAGMESPNGVRVAARVCPDCAGKPEQFGELGKHVVIPASVRERGKLFRYLVTRFALQSQSAGVLPVVIRTPKEAGRQTPTAILLYEEGAKLKGVVTPFPWFGDDPQIMCGRAAEDALSLHRAIVAGKASFTIVGGALIVESATPDLLREWGRA